MEDRRSPRDDAGTPRPPEPGADPAGAAGPSAPRPLPDPIRDDEQGNPELM